jgi:hypothetical protein
MGDRDRMADIPLRFLNSSHDARAAYDWIRAGWMLVSRAMQDSACRRAPALLVATSVFAGGVAIHDARAGRALPRKPR